MSMEALEASIEGVRRIGDFADRLAGATAGSTGLREAADNLESEVKAALFDDLDAPGALAALYSFVRRANAEFDRVDAAPSTAAGGSSALERARQVFASVDGVLDLVPEREVGDANLAAYVEERLAARAAARARRDFAAADTIRRELTERGIAIEDTSSGTKWKPIRPTSGVG